MTKSTQNTDGTDSMHTCETHEADLSAILDGELATVDLKRTLDHLVACRSCSDFYRRSRELENALVESRGDAERAEDVAPSAEVWQKIAERAPWAEVGSSEAEDSNVEPIRPASVRQLRSSRRRQVMEWAPRLAAAFVLAFGLWMVHLVTREAGSAEFFRQNAEASVDVLSEEDLSESTIDETAAAGQEMDEERFVKLATEVLEADPRYQYEMLEVMKTATRARSREATADRRRVDETVDFSGRRTGDDVTSGDRVWR